VWILNAADARVYNNTFMDAPFTFERNERSATGDHFGWHPATGPDVDQREGIVFANNLLVASAAYRLPLMRFEQPAALCAKLNKPAAKETGGNVFVRLGAPGPLVVWSPAAAASGCVARLESLDEFRKAAAGFEAGSLQMDQTPASIFKGPDMGRYELRQPLPARSGGPATPADVRKVLGWSEEQARTAGAFPASR
jgi:hypothetical protein